MPSPVAPKAAAAALADLWSPRVIGELDEHYLKVAKVHGELCWHAHDHEDELFFVLQGHLRIELETADAVELDEGELFVVPSGVRHNPVADAECLILLIERRSTLHTGNEITERTRSLAEQLGTR